MAKFLDASGVKHFWGKITDWVNGLGISHSDIDKLTYSSPTSDTAFDFPRISLERNYDPISYASDNGGLKIKNGYKYVQAGYVPVLFCKMRHRKRGGRYIKRPRLYYQSEFMRHPSVFLTIGESGTLGMFWRLSREDVDTFSSDKFSNCKYFFRGFEFNKLYTNTDFANILCKTEHNTSNYPVYVHTYKYCPLQRGGYYNSHYHFSCIRSWKYEKRGDAIGDAYDVQAWMLRSMEFEFKIGFCPNYFSYRNPNTKEYIKYDPTDQFRPDYFYYYSDYLDDNTSFYDEYMDTTREFPIEINHRYKLSDCVSNIVTFKCVSSKGESVCHTTSFKLIVC